MNIETKTCVKIGISLFLFYLAVYYWPAAAGFAGTLIGAAAPLLAGCVIAYIINILMSFYERHYFPGTKKPALSKSRRPVCLAAAFCSLIAAFALIIALIVPQLIACARLIFARLPGVLESAVAWFEGWDVLSGDMAAFLDSIDWQSKISQIIHAFTSGIGDVAGVIVNVASSVFSGIVTAFLAIIFTIYLLMGKDRLGRQFDRLMKRYLRKSWYGRIRYFLAILDDCFHRYIVGQCTEAVILGTLCALGMWVLRLPYAAMIGTLIAFTALIPVAGAYIGGGIGAFMIFTESPIKAVIFIVFLVALQQFEGNIIYPRVVGSSMGLPGIWVLAAVTIGGGLMGVAGMLMAVPLAAFLYRVLKNDVNKTAVKF